jgi:hypothetical protein
MYGIDYGRKKYKVFDPIGSKFTRDYRCTCIISIDGRQIDHVSVDVCTTNEFLQSPQEG